MQVSLKEPVYLSFLLLLPVVYLIYKYRTENVALTRNKIVLVLRLIVVILLIFSLAQPIVYIMGDNLSVILLADRSYSISSQQQQEAKDFIKEAIKNKKPDDQLGIISFGEEAMVELAMDKEPVFYDYESTVSANYTSISEGLRLAMSTLPSKGNKRIVLISDGCENTGNVKALFKNLQESGIAVDIYPLKEELTAEVMVKSLYLPDRIPAQKEFKIKITIFSNRSTEGRITVYRNNTIIKDKDVKLKEGNNYFSFKELLSTGGFYEYSVEIDTENDQIKENNIQKGFTICEGKPKLALVGGTGMEKEFFISSLNDHGLLIDHYRVDEFSFSLNELQQYNTIILANLHADLINIKQMQNLQKYVREMGGGLLVIGGDRSFGRGEYSGTPLEEMLPVRTDIKNKVLFPTTSLIIVIDKSDSMSEIPPGTGKFSKLDLAKEATVAILDLLVKNEKIGVVAFDSTASLVAPLQDAAHKADILKKLAVLQPGGGTSIYEGLKVAYDMFTGDESAVKHVILLSDGKSVPGPFVEIIEDMKGNNISLTTVAIGEKVDKELMAQLAELGGGRYYYTREIRSLPQIFVSETRRITSSALVEKTIQPVINPGLFEVMSFEIDKIPHLEGYVATSPRKLADILMSTPDKYPLLASWRYGLGRTAVFTSDLGAKYSRQWLEWEKYGLFWADIIHPLLRNRDVSNIFPVISVEGNKGLITVNAFDKRGDFLNFMDLRAVVSDPVDTIHEIKLEQRGSGLYQGEFTMGPAGVYLVTLIREKGTREEKLLTTGFVQGYSPEYKLPNYDIELMKKLSNKTGGRLLTSAKDIYVNRTLQRTGEMSIWKWLVLLAVVLFLIDIALRVVDFQLLRRLIITLYNRYTGVVKKIREGIKE